MEDKYVIEYIINGWRFRLNINDATEFHRILANLIFNGFCNNLTRLVRNGEEVTL